MKRMLMLVCVLLTAGLLAFAGGQGEAGDTMGEEDIETSPEDVSQKEAPMLASLVAAGELPPVEERLPVNPVVVEPVEELGVYGGTVRALTNETSYWGDGELLIPREPPLRLAEGGEVAIPNVIESWEFSDDLTTFTFRLREGLKWSDGYELTSEDIMFWWNDVIMNKDLTPSVPKTLRFGREPAEVHAVDEYTVEMKFAGPVPTITDDLAFWFGIGTITNWHKGYLSQFHPAYTPQDELDKKVKDAGFDNWWELFGASQWNQRGYHTRLKPTEIPTLQPYMITKVEGNLITLERNPYYWKVDTAGRQLPYIDRVIVERVEDAEVMDAKRIAGDADLGARGFPLNKYSLALDNAEKSDYRVLMWEKPYSTDVLYQFNQTYADDLVLRDIFRDVRFRKAMSLALNREEISDIVYRGLADPVQQTISPKIGSVYYVEDYADVYAQYDPGEANRLLDEMGLEKNADGMRLRPDGKPLQILLEYYNVETPKRQITELAKRYWADIGVQVDSREITGTMVSTRAVSNSMQMGLWHGNRASSLCLRTYPYWYLPVLGWEKTWCPLWAHWYQSGGTAAQGEEPPQTIKDAIHAWEQLRLTLDEDEQKKWAQELLSYQAENLWTIGTVAGAPQPVIVRNNLRNVPEEGYLGWDVQQMDTYHPEQFFVMPD
jgi:peptide/nickel transport system substrate-binding protein